MFPGLGRGSLLVICRNYEYNAEIPGFSLIFRHREKSVRKSGGIAMFIKEKYSTNVQPLKGNEHEYALWCKLDEAILGFEVIIGAIYITPVNSLYSHGDEFDLVMHDLTDLNAKFEVPFILVGDLNARTGTLKDDVNMETCIA